MNDFGLKEKKRKREREKQLLFKRKFVLLIHFYHQINMNDNCDQNRMILFLVSGCNILLREEERERKMFVRKRNGGIDKRGDEFLIEVFELS